MSTMRNSVMLIGYPTQPVMDSEKDEARFNINVAESFKDDCGCWKQRTFTFDCVGRGKIAKRIVSQINEGRLIAIEGGLRNYRYQDRLGDTHDHTEIEMFDLLIIETKKEK